MKKKKKNTYSLGGKFLATLFPAHFFNIRGKPKSNRVGEKRFFKESENKLVNISI